MDDEEYRWVGDTNVPLSALIASGHDPIALLACALAIALDVLGDDEVVIADRRADGPARTWTFRHGEGDLPVVDMMERFTSASATTDPISATVMFITTDADEPSIDDDEGSIVLVASERDDTVELRIVDAALDREVMPHVLSALVAHIAREIAADAHRQAATIPLVTDDALAWLVHDLNDVAAEYPPEPTIHGLVLRVASGTPDAIAIDDVDGAVTYADLVERANGIAENLRAARLRPREGVGVIFPRGADCVAAMLGVLLAGGCYVPIALDEPESRRERLLDQLGIRLLLQGAASGGVELVPRAGDGLVLLPGADEDSEPLYVMFTSGSTGDPKAVVVTHRAAIRLVRDPWFAAITSDDGIGFASNPAFDAATWEVWGALTNGARLVPLATHEVARAEAFEERIRERRVSCLFVTTSLFNSHARTAPTMFGALRMLGIGGEAADPSTCRRVLASGSPPDALINAYGPTETTTFASWYRVSHVSVGAVRLPIGGPICNTTLHVLDRHGRHVPPGVPGELFIGGDALAIGYYGDPELTAKKFVPDPFAGPPHRLYASGDLVVREPDGAIVFLRRRDHQLKIRGYRVEPIEIEAAMRDIDGVTAAVVVPHEVEGYPRLVAYTIVDTPHVDASTVRTKLRAVLPDYLVPSHIVLVDDLPLTRSGKLDRAQLPDPFASTLVTSSSSSSTLESVDERLDGSIVDLWYQVLGTDAVDPTATFFEAGGDSLLAVRLYGMVQRRFGVVLPSGTIDQAFTITRFVAAVRQALQRSAPPLVTEMTTTDGPLIVLVSPGGGELDRYRWLVPPLADRFHVVGVREPGHYGTEPRPRTMEGVSAACLDGLRRAGFHTPVAVVGECSGGVLAHQLAYDFARQGRSPELAVLLDTPIPGGFGPDPEPEQFATLVRRRGRNAVALAQMQARWSWHRVRHEPAPVALAHSMTLRNNARRVRDARPSVFDGHLLYVQAVDDHGEAATSGAPEYWRRRSALSRGGHRVRHARWHRVVPLAVERPSDRRCDRPRARAFAQGRRRMIRVWLQAVPVLRATAHRAPCLSYAETARAANLRSPQQRGAYLAVHRWMHSRVADVLGVQGDRLPLGIDGCGAPVLDGYVHRLGLSHHGDHVALAMSDGEPVGIDVLTVPTDVEFVADTGLVLSAAEIMLVRSALPERRGALFAACWTRKEAYAKFLRTGLTQGLDCLTLTPSADGSTGARFWTARLGDTVVSVATDVAAPLDVAVVV